MSNGLSDHVAELPGLMKELWDRLTGPTSVLWVRALRRTLRKEDPWPAPKVWKTLRIGGKSKGELLAELRTAGFTPYGDAEAMMANKVFRAGSEETELDLALCSLAELGCRDGEHLLLGEVIALAAEFGLEPCPQSLGPYLRLAYSGGQWVHVAMEPIVCSGTPRIFCMGSSDAIPGCRLTDREAYPEVSYWASGQKFVFVIPRKKAA